MSLQIPITGVDAGFRVPGNYLEAIFAQGPATASAPAREVVLVMPMTSSGTWTANTLYQINNESDAQGGAGAGSPLHQAARMFLQANKTAKLWAVPFAASSGTGAVSSAVSATITGPATAQGTISISVGPDTASYTFKSGDSATVIGDGLAAAVNAMTWIQFTAADAAGVVTLTSKIAGASSNLGTRPIRTAVTSGVGVTFAGSGLVSGVDGTTTEAANLATALNTINAVRKYYIVVSTNDSTGLGNLKTHIINKSLPRQGLRSVGISASRDTLSNSITLATGKNYERLQIAWQPNGDFSVAELAASMAAIRQSLESTDSAHNFDLFRGDSTIAWLVPPAFATTDWPVISDLSDAINGGLAPIASDGSGSFLVMSTTTRSKNSSGTVNDARALQSHRVSVTDDFSDTLLVDFALNFGAKKLKDDERLADGTVNPNQRPIRDVVKPSDLRGTVQKELDDFERAGKIQDAAASKSSLRLNKVGGRVEMGLDLHVIDWLDQTTTRIAEVSTG